MFALLAATWVVVVAAALAVLSYERRPHITDEVAYFLQARYLAAGMLTMPAPPAPEAFFLDLMYVEDTRWYSIFPPGWPLVLAAGVLAGVPWLVNPLLAGLNLLGVSALLRQLYDRRTARLALLLLCLSPWYLFMAMSFMSHTFALTCGLAGALGMLRAGQTGRAVWAGAAGGAVGLLSLVRPLDGFVIAALLTVWALGLAGRRLPASSVAAFVLGTVLVGAVVLPYNALLTGRPTELPVNAYFDRYFWPGANAFGFGSAPGVGWHLDAFPGHSPLEGFINANLNTYSINVELFGWSTGSLLLAAYLLVSGGCRRADRLMLAVIAAVFVAHFFYYFNGGPDLGARYWYLMLVPCVALTVRGADALAASLGPGDGSPSPLGAQVVVAVLAVSALALVNYVPWRAIDKYHHYLGLRSDLPALARGHGFGRGLVLVQGRSRPDYAAAATYNPLDLRADAPIYVWDRDPDVRRRALAAYPDRPVWIVRGPSQTGQGFELVDGPLSAAEAGERSSRNR